MNTKSRAYHTSRPGPPPAVRMRTYVCYERIPTTSTGHTVVMRAQIATYSDLAGVGFTTTVGSLSGETPQFRRDIAHMLRWWRRLLAGTVRHGDTPDERCLEVRVQERHTGSKDIKYRAIQRTPNWPDD